jgi:CheY-like chemotaxis protein
LGAIVCCAVLLGGLSLARYQGYNAGMLDLGNMAQAIASVARGQPLVLTYPAGNASRLAGHVELIYLLLAPLYAWWPDPRLLLEIQAALFALVLRMAGYQVTGARDAETAFTLLAERQYDLVLTDWELPGMWGDEFVRTATARYPGTITVLMSNDRQVRGAALAAKATTWFCKQDGIICLRSVVASALHEDSSDLQRWLLPAM